MLAPDSAEAPWSLSRRLFFRFVFVYLVIYSLPFPLDLVPGDQIPEAKIAVTHYESASDTALAWFGNHVLGIEQSLARFETGSGDTTRSYVALVMQVSMAVVIAGIWSWLSRRTHHTRLADLLRTYVRYVLGVTMLGYGTAKFFGGQFPSTDGIWLFTTWGESSPMGVVWKFMAASPAYTTCTGIVECLGGLLLFWRRTTTLGAMVSAAGMLNVMLMNFCYDVPVKLYSAHLLLMAIGLLLRDAPRLAAVLLWHRPSEPLPLRLRLPIWVFVPERLAKFAIVGWILFSSGQSVYTRWQSQGEPAGPLDGLYEVAEFVRDGAVVSPLLADASRWQHLFLVRNRERTRDDEAEAFAQLAMTDGKTRAYYQAAVDTARSTVTLKPFRRPGTEVDAAASVVLAYRRETPGAGGKPEAAEAAAAAGPTAVEAPAKPEQAPAAPVPAVVAAPTPPLVAAPAPAVIAEPTEALLVLEGTYQGAAIQVRLRERRGDSFLLRNRGFHWISEYPFNR